jgi:hypothetical protein
MPSFTTINRRDDQGRIVKYDNYSTEAEAQARIVELHDMGLTDAFYVDDNAVAVGNERCFQKTHHWVADPVAKTVTLDQVSFDAEVRDDNFAVLRAERNKRLEESDKSVNPDQWSLLNAETQTSWAEYRQQLRDLPATTDDPANPTWPTEPAGD